MRTLQLALPVAVLVIVCACPVSAQQRPYRIAVVVGNDSSQEEGLEPLKFADDDAFKYAWFFSFAADEVTLFTRADEESAALYADRTATPPTRKAVLNGIDTAVAKASEHAEMGDDVILYLVYSGHGNYDREGRGYLHLEDGKLTTRDLFHHLIGRSDGFSVVLLFDACNAGFLVRSKGASDRRPAGRTSLALEDYDNVGLVLSSSSSGEVKEWGRYLAGIFSHQVRSALSGAADADRDDRVTFGELAAFVEAANREVENPALRLRPYVRPPLSRPDLPLVDFKHSTFKRFLSVGPGVPGQMTVLDADLVRYADFRLETGFAPLVALAGNREYHLSLEDGTEYTVTSPSSPLASLGVLPPEGGDETGDQRGSSLPRPLEGTALVPEIVLFESLQPNTAGTIASRGADEYLGRALFSVAYGREFASRYLESEYPGSLVFTRFEERPWYENEWAWAATGAGLVLAGTSAYFYSRALDSHEQALTETWADRRNDLNRDASGFREIAIGTGIASGAAVAAGLALFILDRPIERVLVNPKLGHLGLKIEPESDSLGLSLSPGPGPVVLVPTPDGAMLESRF